MAECLQQRKNMLEEGNQGVNSGGYEGLITPNQSPRGLSLAVRLEPQTPTVQEAQTLVAKSSPGCSQPPPCKQLQMVQTWPQNRSQTKGCSVLQSSGRLTQGLPTFLTRLTTQTRNKQTGRILAIEAQPWCMCGPHMTRHVTREGVLDLGSGEE